MGEDEVGLQEVDGGEMGAEEEDPRFSEYWHLFPVE